MSLESNEKSSKIVEPLVVQSIPFIEFNDELSDVMNSEKVLCVVAPAGSPIAAVLETVLLDVIGSVAQGLATVDDDVRPDALALTKLRRVRFSTAENIEKFELCTAVHGLVPLVALVDMDGDRSFVISLKQVETTAEDARKQRLTELLKAFVGDLINDRWPKAKQGAPRPSEDRSPEFKNLLFAVQCSFHELVHEYNGDVFVILWSPHCPCCPEALKCMDAFMAAVLDQDPTIRLRCVACNAEENELSPTDWPTNTAEQVVPMIKLYVDCGNAPDVGRHPCSGAESSTKSSKTCFKFTGKRNCDAIMDFVVEHSTVLPATFSKTTAVAAWAQFKAKRLRE